MVSTTLCQPLTSKPEPSGGESVDSRLGVNSNRFGRLAATAATALA